MYLCQCPLMNISYCPPSETTLSNGKDLVNFYHLHCNSFLWLVDMVFCFSFTVYLYDLWLFLPVDTSGLQPSWMEERRHSSNTCMYSSSLNSIGQACEAVFIERWIIFSNLGIPFNQLICRCSYCQDGSMSRICLFSLNSVPEVLMDVAFVIPASNMLFYLLVSHDILLPV